MLEAASRGKEQRAAAFRRSRCLARRCVCWCLLALLGARKGGLCIENPRHCGLASATGQPTPMRARSRYSPCSGLKAQSFAAGIPRRRAQSRADGDCAAVRAPRSFCRRQVPFNAVSDHGLSSIRPEASSGDSPPCCQARFNALIVVKPQLPGRHLLRQGRRHRALLGLRRHLAKSSSAPGIAWSSTSTSWTSS